MSLRHNYDIDVVNIDKPCRTPYMGVVPPIPELTSGRKVKGTKTRSHTMKEIGSLMTGKSILIMHAVLKNTPAHTGRGVVGP